MDAVYLAKLAEKAERYDEMVEYMKEVATGSETPLTMEERNLLSVAYKNVVGARRASLRIIDSVESNHVGFDRNTEKEQLTSTYKGKVEVELNSICNDVLSLLQDSLIPNATGAEATVFYMKMNGDYNRYLAEFAMGATKSDYARRAQDAYETASVQAQNLVPTHPIRLGLALNFSVFRYEVQANAKSACELAKSAFDDAIAELDTLDEDMYKDATLIMQLLRDNLMLWDSVSDEQS